MIDEDQRNNSAWNQRWTAVHKGNTKRDNPLTLETAKSEADYALGVCRMDPYNESPWRYLVALLKEQPSSNAWIKEIEQTSASMTQVLVDANRDPEKCINMTWARVDMLEMAGDKESLEKVSCHRVALMVVFLFQFLKSDFLFVSYLFHKGDTNGTRFGNQTRYDSKQVLEATSEPASRKGCFHIIA